MDVEVGLGLGVADGVTLGVGVRVTVGVLVNVGVGVRVTCCASLTCSGSVCRLAITSPTSVHSSARRPNIAGQSAIARAHLSIGVTILR